MHAVTTATAAGKTQVAARSLGLLVQYTVQRWPARCGVLHQNGLLLHQA
jgi:hypothetical protein